MTVSGIKFGITETLELSSASSNAKSPAAFNSEVESVVEVSGATANAFTSIGASADVLTDSYGVYAAAAIVEASRLTGITIPASRA
jgi:hypothetical protein